MRPNILLIAASCVVMIADAGHSQTAPVDYSSQCSLVLEQALTGKLNGRAAAMAPWVKSRCSANNYSAFKSVLAREATAGDSEKALDVEMSASSQAAAQIATAAATRQATDQSAYSEGMAGIAGSTPTVGGVTGAGAAGASAAGKTALCHELLTNANQCRQNQANLASPGTTGLGTTGQAGAFNDCYNMYMGAYHAERCG